MAIADPAAGVRLIATYKLVKSLAQWAGALVLISRPGHALLASGARAAEWVVVHATRASFIALARAVGSLLRTDHTKLLALALAADGTLGLVEAWALRRGFKWAPWLVVAATASLIPYELFELTRLLNATRVVLLVLNVLIVLYLVRHALRSRSQVAHS